MIFLAGFYLDGVVPVVWKCCWIADYEIKSLLAV